MKIEDVMGGFNASGESSYSMQVSTGDNVAVISISSETYNQLAKLVGISEGGPPEIKNSGRDSNPPLPDQPSRSEGDAAGGFGEIPDNVLQDITPVGLFSDEIEEPAKKTSPYEDPDGLDVI